MISQPLTLFRWWKRKRKLGKVVLNVSRALRIRRAIARKKQKPLRFAYVNGIPQMRCDFRAVGET
jgi:hypothetical protein